MMELNVDDCTECWWLETPWELILFSQFYRFSMNFVFLHSTTVFFNSLEKIVILLANQ